MALTHEELTKPLTVTEAKQSIYDGLAIVGVPTTSWKAGAVVRTIVAIVAIMLAALSRMMNSIATGGFLLLASGDWLTLVARYVYGVERIQATFASGAITFVNAGGGVYSGDPDELIVSNSVTGATYRNTEAFSIGAGATVTIQFQAVESGSASTAASAGDIDEIETPLIGVSCSNPAALIGVDEESDSDLQTRCLAKLGALSPNGPKDAFDFVARSAVRADGSAIGVTRTKVTNNGEGQLTVLVADATGQVADAGDLAIIQRDIAEQAEPQAITATAVSATARVVNVSATVWAYNDLSESDAAYEAAAAAALTTHLATTPIGGDAKGELSGYVWHDVLRDKIRGGRSAVYTVDVSEPAADVVLSATEAPVLGTFTLTINRKARN